MLKALRTRGSRTCSTLHARSQARATTSASDSRSLPVAARIERYRPWLALALPLGIALAGACGDAGNTTMDPSAVNVGAGGTTSGASPGGSPGGSMPASPSTTGGGTQGGASMAGSTMGGATTGGGAQGGAVTGGATTGGATMGGATTGGGTTGGGMPSNADLKTKCEAGERMGCRTVQSPSGMEIELGPYGAAMDVNVGKGFENTVSLLDNNTSCASFAAQFGQSKESTDKLLDLRGLDLKLYTVYRPAKWVDGETYPVVTWGNGTCAQPEGYASLLRYVASHGFIVVAPNSRYVGSGDEQKRSLDFLFKATADSTSPYYKKVDTTHVAAMGHSQGSQSTINAASDARIKSVILFNVGTSARKPFLAISGDRDIAGALSTFKSALASATKGAYLWMHMVPGKGNADGHLTLMVQPERLTGATVAWLKYTLFDDADSKTWFAGTTCKLCGHDAEYEFAAKGL